MSTAAVSLVESNTKFMSELFALICYVFFFYETGKLSLLSFLD